MARQNEMSFLLSPEAAGLRKIRREGYAKFRYATPNYVVHIETSSYQFVELDADDEQHAMNLVKVWLRGGANMTARYHKINDDGSLSNSSRIFDQGEFKFE